MTTILAELDFVILSWVYIAPSQLIDTDGDLQGAEHPAADYQQEERGIVGSSNAVVEPFAVVVKAMDAAIALSAVLAALLYIGLQSNHLDTSLDGLSSKPAGQGPFQGCYLSTLDSYWSVKYLLTQALILKG